MWKGLQGLKSGNPHSVGDLETEDAGWKGVGGVQKEDFTEMTAKWRNMNFSKMADNMADKVSKIMAWATYEGHVPVMRTLRSIVRWRRRRGGGGWTGHVRWGSTPGL